MPKARPSRRNTDNVVRLNLVPSVARHGPVDQDTVDVLYDLYRQALEGKVTGLLYHATHPNERCSNGVTGIIVDHPEHGVYGAARLMHLCNKGLDAKRG